jgi:hypothetical protein
VLVGDVWLGSGQSNMQWAVRQTNNADQKSHRRSSRTFASSTYPANLLRFPSTTWMPDGLSVPPKQSKNSPQFSTISDASCTRI